MQTSASRDPFAGTRHTLFSSGSTTHGSGTWGTPMLSRSVLSTAKRAHLSASHSGSHQHPDRPSAALVAALRACQNRIAELEHEHDTVRTDQSALKLKVDQLKQEKQAALEAAAVAEERILELTHELSDERKQHARAVEQLAKDLSAATRERAAMQEELEGAHAKAAQLQVELNSMRSEAADATQHVAQLREQDEERVKHIGVLEERVWRAERSLQQHDFRSGSLEGACRDLLQVSRSLLQHQLKRPVSRNGIPKKRKPLARSAVQAMADKVDAAERSLDEPRTPPSASGPKRGSNGRVGVAAGLGAVYDDGSSPRAPAVPAGDVQAPFIVGTHAGPSYNVVVNRALSAQRERAPNSGERRARPVESPAGTAKYVSTMRSALAAREEAARANPRIAGGIADSGVDRASFDHHH